MADRGDTMSDPQMGILLDQSAELRKISHTLGKMEQRLEDGHEVHIETARVLRLHDASHRNLHARVRTLEKQRQSKPEEKKSSLAEWTEFLKVFWPYVAVTALIAWRLVLGSTEPLTTWIEHLGGKS